jgi:hypothetical protein
MPAKALFTVMQTARHERLSHDYASQNRSGAARWETAWTQNWFTNIVFDKPIWRSDGESGIENFGHTGSAMKMRGNPSGSAVINQPHSQWRGLGPYKEIPAY